MSFPRYPQYKDSGIEWLGEIPADWKIVRLKDSFAVSLGKMLQPDQLTSTDELLPYLRASNVKWEGADLTDVKQMWIAASEKPHLRLRSGDLLVSEGGDVGRSCIWNGEIEECYYQNSINRIRPIGNDSIEFLYYWMFVIKEKGFVDVLCNKSTIAHFTAEKVANVPVPIPSVPEQHAIVHFLVEATNRLDNLIDLQVRLIELLSEKRRTVISHAVTKGLNPQARMKPSGIDWLGDVPAHWNVAALARITDRVVVGIAEAATHAYVDEGVPILRSTNIRPGKIVGDILFVDTQYAADRHAKRINAGDLVTVRTGNPGVTALIPQDLDGCQCFTMLISTLKSGYYGEYYSYWMNSAPAAWYFTLESWGTAQANISVPILKALPVPVPPIPEQIAIANELDRTTAQLDHLITQAKTAIELLQERRAALVSAAVTGKIDVRGIMSAEAA